MDDDMQPGYADGEQMSASAIDMLELATQSPNIAGEIDADLRGQIATRVIEQYAIDKASRSEWEEEARLAMEAVLQKPEAKNYPFEGASNIKYPVLTSAVLQFGARTYPALIPGDRVVKVKVVGKDPYGLKQARAERLATHMSWQLMKDMPWWEQDMDVLVHQLPGVGHAFKKVYYDHDTGKPCSHLVSAMNVVVNQGARDLESVPRITQIIDDLYPHQIDERIRAGTFIEFEYGHAAPAPAPGGAAAPSWDGQDDDAPHLFLEQHRYEDLDGDGLREPWIVTVHKDTSTVVRIASGYDLRRAVIRDDGEIVRLPRRAYFVGYPFLPDPLGGYYGIGFGRLLRPIGEAVNTSLNQIIDAAHLQNAGGGFIGSGLNTKKSTMRVEMNKWTTVQATGKTIREAIVPHTFPGPSPVLFNVLGMLLDAAKGIASVQDVMTGEAKAQTMQPTTLLALIEQGMKVYTSIVKRIFRSQASEFAMLYAINREYPDEEAYQRVIDWEPPQQLLQMLQQLQQAAAEAEAQGMPAPPPPPPQIMLHLQQPTVDGDYADEDCDVAPVADPSQVTDMQKMAKAQLLMETQGHPNVNKEAAIRRVYQAANIEDIDQLIVAAPAGPDPMMVENAMAEIQKKKASAMKDLALADKASVETEGQKQTIALEHAQMASGAMDEDAMLDREMKRQQGNKTDLEMRLSQRQQEMAERQAQSESRGEVA